MLELDKILQDIDKLGRDRAQVFSGLEEELARASDIISEMARDPASASRRIRDARTSWLVAEFDERPDAIYDVPAVPNAHAVVAADGSQIMPGKHEVTLCYLINTAGIILYYGTGERPVAWTTPKLCYTEEELFEEPYGGRRVPINEKFISIRRTLAESQEIERAIKAAAGAGIPTVALWDGSLIRWVLENEPQDYRGSVITRYLQAFDTARELRIPIAGYISDPGSRDFVNSMRIMLCGENPVDCDKCSHKASGESAPCDAIAHLKDALVFKQAIVGGKRSTLLGSNSKVLEHYGPHKIKAFYMDAGFETVRIEIPAWVAEDRQLLELTHAVCWDQACKARGYPISLAEAHERAVVRNPDREVLFELIERSFVKHGARVTYSLKRTAKGY